MLRSYPVIAPLHRCCALAASGCTNCDIGAGWKDQDGRRDAAAIAVRQLRHRVGRRSGRFGAHSLALTYPTTVMRHRKFGATLRGLVLGFVALVAAACSTSDTMRVQEPMPAPSAGDSEKYAALVIDGNSGRTLHAVNAEELRYPASLTKMMTLYMLFEAMQAGQVTTATEMPVSQHAASQPPSKMGLRTGETIDATSAIQALATKSANDVAAVVGEYLGGTEDQFAARMTSKARQLGMRRTVFRNASGLPDTSQVTSARDMAVLGMQLRKRFPQYFRVFSATDFGFRGRVIRGHNDMMGRVRGVNGIKTGYIRASGFNIVTSVEADGKRLIVVIMGGKTARARNAEVEALIQRFLPGATTGGAS